MAAGLAEKLASDSEQATILDRLLKTRNRLSQDPQVVITGISNEFISLKYLDHALDRRELAHEELVIDLQRLDCVTLLEYVEKIRRRRP